MSTRPQRLRPRRRIHCGRKREHLQAALRKPQYCNTRHRPNNFGIQDSALVAGADSIAGAATPGSGGHSGTLTNAIAAPRERRPVQIQIVCGAGHYPEWQREYISAVRAQLTVHLAPARHVQRRPRTSPIQSSAVQTWPMAINAADVFNQINSAMALTSLPTARQLRISHCGANHGVECDGLSTGGTYANHFYFLRR